MKKLLKKADQLLEKIEMGFLTRDQAMYQIRELRAEITLKFEEGSDEFQQCIYPLIDAHEIAINL